MNPREFAIELSKYWSEGYDSAAKRIAARDAEVREEKRKEVVLELDHLLQTTSVVGYDSSSAAAAAQSVWRLTSKLIFTAKSLEPPAPEPSARAMRVAMENYRECGAREPIVTRLALLIDAEFGGGK